MTRSVPEPPRRLPIAAESQDWRWQVRHAVRSLEELERWLTLSSDERAGTLAAQSEGFPVAITPYYLGLLDPTDPNCPLRRQVVPTRAESDPTPGDLRDPLGEEAHEVAPELVRRYPDRVLLLVTDRCSTYCRFCTRSRMVGNGGGPRSLERLAPALAYIAAHPEIREVLVSGGDPLAMSTERLLPILEAIRAIASVDLLRLATRVPVTLPQRIDAELIAALRPLHPIWVMTHFNHPRELSPEATRALSLLADGGFPVMNQTVLLRGINDNVTTLTELFRGLVKRRVRPYYLLQADPVRGTGHLRTTVAQGRELMRALQGNLSGIALPKYIVDTPGGFGKVPAGPSFEVSSALGTTRFRTHRGVEVDYIDPPDARRVDSVHQPQDHQQDQ